MVPKPEESQASSSTPKIEANFIAPKAVLGGGRRKFKELRQKLQNDDEDTPSNPTPPNSQTSSIEGVYASSNSNKTTHPFRVIELDTVSIQSINSIGRVGRPINGPAAECAQSSNSALSTSSVSSSTPSSKETSQYPSTATLATSTVTTTTEVEVESGVTLQEPDVIASTKSSVVKSLSDDAPVAPPRRKKKNKAASLPITPSTSSVFGSVLSGVDISMSNNSKSSTIKSVHGLDIREVTKGKFVVKPQDVLSIEADKDGKNTKDKEKASRGSTNRSSMGHYSLGPHRNVNKRNARERRKSAGDENMLKGMDIHVRTRTDSGKHLTDYEILQQVTVLNLDTGERVPLSVAEDKLPQCINPLSLHIMRLTSEYVSSSSMDKDKESDDESIMSMKKLDNQQDADDDVEIDVGRMRKRTAKIKKFLGSTVKKTMHKAKSIAQEVSHARHKEEVVDMLDEVHPGEHNIKLKAANSHKGPYDFERMQHVQELNNEHVGPIWCMKFSNCGRLMATAGQDRVLRIWIIKEHFAYFQDMRTKYNADKVSPTPSQESLVSHHSGETSTCTADMLNAEDASKFVFMPRPFCTYSGHTSDLLDVSWSKTYFILSSSMDKTVRLWHISRKECLCCFQHIDFVTAIAFHPKDDRYFLSGSLDGKIRLWNIPDKKVAVWNEIEGTTKLITAANFCQNGKFAVIGSYDGRCIFYNTDQLKYHTQIHVRSTRGRNATGRKISGIEPMPGEDKILVTSNDSRIRLYDLRDLSLSCKYKGYANVSSQIKASFSHDGKYVVSGSENRDIYIWKTSHDYTKSLRRDRNDFWEAIKAHNAVVTCAIFAPNPDNIIEMLREGDNNSNGEQDEKEKDPIIEQRDKGCGGYVLISADFNGCIKIFVNKMKPKHSSLPASALA